MAPISNLRYIGVIRRFEPSIRHKPKRQIQEVLEMNTLNTMKTLDTTSNNQKTNTIDFLEITA